MTRQPTIQLTREIRFYLPPRRRGDEADCVFNSWAGWPTSVAVAPFLSLRCTLEGPVDSRSNYVCNVKQVDQMLREHALKPVWESNSLQSGETTPGNLLIQFWRRTADHVPAGTQLDAMQLGVSPFLDFFLSRSSYPMIRVSQQFEFSASHRLHNLALSDAENRELYGKCNNPHGHGHNYVLEVELELAEGEAGRYSTTTAERIVKSTIIDRLDHRHLNIEVPPFDRLNPTVENIAVTIWDWLVHEFPPPTRLSRIRVYETPKTWADYCGR